MTKPAPKFKVSLRGNRLFADLTVRDGKATTSFDIDPDLALGIIEELGFLDEVEEGDDFTVSIVGQGDEKQGQAIGSRYLNIREVAERLNLSVRTVFRNEREDSSFPASRRISKGRIGWLESEIEDYMNNAPANKPSRRRV
jgi:predicted DNA-binding transcriptional regulator AlpA